MWDHLLLRTPKEIASTACSSVLTIMQDKAQFPRSAAADRPSSSSAQPTGTTSSSAGTMETQQAATAAALSGTGAWGLVIDGSIE